MPDDTGIHTLTFTPTLYQPSCTSMSLADTLLDARARPIRPVATYIGLRLRDA